eukprot:TRINITY_DN135057_c2_g1_i1.p3 TRINITY_DN135057_c2_g1~~TRINITY_DN135057_c2_g1_i1.p3  ORF type:complete len:318 (-),score=36.40 TRINITY_DN135057_c2_g1_i1:101-1054(-)
MYLLRRIIDFPQYYNNKYIKIPMDAKPEIGGLDKVYAGIMEAVKKISEKLREDTLAEVGQNSFGDKQFKIDVVCDQIVYQELKITRAVAYAMSEEQPFPTELGGKDFIVTLDPLDGGSVIASNFSVGSIFAIWPNKDKLMGLKGRDMVGAMIAIYGPRTEVILYNAKNKQVDQMKLSKEGWVLSKSNLTIKESTRLFAPGNLRATTENKGYKEVVDYWLNSGYTLRYTGAMVPDIYQIFIKGEGIFSNMISSKFPAKLRFLYETAPFAFLVEAAGGRSTDGTKSLLDTTVEGYEMKGPIAVGSKTEVERIETCMKKY